MENYNRSVCGCHKTSGCLNIVLSVIGALLSFALGLIIGLSFFETLTTYFTAIVAITIVLAVMLVVFLILKVCTDTQSRC